MGSRETFVLTVTNVALSFGKPLPGPQVIDPLVPVECFFAF